MEFSGKQLLPAKPQQVWDVLVDPTRLALCIPGCESIARLDSPDQYEAAVVTRIGPVSARFRGTMQLSDLEKPSSYRLSFEGNAGAAGFAKGTANVRLQETSDGTELSYSAQAQVGGKLAQVGSRLIDAAAQKLTGEFFSRFAEHWGQISQRALDGVAESSPVTPDASVTVLPPESSRRRLRWIFAAGVALLLLGIAYVQFL